MCHLVHFHLDYALFMSSGRVIPTAQFCSLFQYFCNGRSLEEKKQKNDFGRKKKTKFIWIGVYKSRAFGREWIKRFQHVKVKADSM